MPTRPEKSFRELWGDGLLGYLHEVLGREVDREVAGTLVPQVALEPLSAVDELAALSKWPHLPPVLRRVAAGGALDYDNDEFKRAVHDAVVRGPRQPGIAQSDLDAEIATALTNAALGIPSPDLHDRVLELMHERDAFGWYHSTKIHEIELDIRSESITAKPRRLVGWPPKPPEPSAVDRLAAQVDPAAAKRVAKMNAAIARSQEAVDDMRDMSALVSVQPMSSPVGGIAFYKPQPQWEPSVVERLAALAEPDGELAQRITDYDDQQTLLSNL